jgi:hypothetical protein
VSGASPREVDRERGKADLAFVASRQRVCGNLITGMAPTVLPPVVCRGLLAIPAEPVIDPVGLAVHRINHAIRWNHGAGIKIRRAVIMQIDILGGVTMVVMVANRHVGSK